MNIRYDWQAIRQGLAGGVSFQRTEWSEDKVDWDETVVEAREEANRKFKPIHNFDGEYLQGIVVVALLPGNKIHFYSFKNPYAP